MTIDAKQLMNMTTRQKAIAGLVFLVILIVIWQVISMFTGGAQQTQPATLNGKGGSSAQAKSNMTPGQPRQQQIQAQGMTQAQQDELARLQRETQEKYIAAVNQLQMLKLSQQIAETSKDIAKAKLDTVTSEKGIVDLLTKPAPEPETSASFSQGLVPGSPLTIQPASPSVAPGSPPGVASMTAPAAPQTTNANYVVISVSQLLNKWGAVLGYQGKLYSVFVGDVVPADQSTVISIDKYSVILEKDGIQRKVSLVPII